MRPRFVDLFENILSRDTSRSDAAYDAILFERGEAIPDLVECYQRPESKADLRRVIVQLLGFTGDVRAVKHVMEALLDKSPIVRSEACLALLDLNAREAIPALRERCEDLDVNVRAAARDALEGLRA